MNNFQTSVIWALCIGIIADVLILLCQKRRGLNIYESKVQFKAILIVLPIVFIPLWIDTESSITNKIIGTLIGLSVAIVNFYFLNKGSKILNNKRKEDCSLDDSAKNRL